MRVLRFGLCVLCYLLISALAAAQQPPQRDPQAVLILQQSLAAMGGSGVLPTSLIGSGTYTQFEVGAEASHTLRLKVLGFDRIRLEVDLPGGTVSIIARGDSAWRLAAGEAEGLPLSQIVGRTSENVPPLALAQWLSTVRFKLQLVGSETIDGRNAYHLSIGETYEGAASPTFKESFEQMKRWELFIDAQTYLPVRIRYSESPGHLRLFVPVDVVFSDFRPVGGLLIPFALTRFVGSQRVTTIQFQAVALNVPLSDAEFSVR